MPTFGEIAKSHGFDSVNNWFNKVTEEINVIKSNSFNVGDKIKLKNNYTPTHFNDEKILPFNTEFIVTEKSNFTLDKYSIKIEGFDSWFNASVFERC